MHDALPISRRLRAGGYADTTNVDAIRKMIPYK